MAYRLPDAWLDDLRGRLDIVDVVSDYVQLRQKGRKHWGLCPFHSEKTPSFSVDSESQMYYCFGCHEGGTVIQFVMELEHMSFMEAVTELADRAHLALPERSGMTQEDSGTKELKERIYLANLQAAHYYHEQLWSDQGAAQLNYLHKRGLDDADIKRFGLGASASGWTDLTDALLKQGFTEDELVKAGLTGRKEHRAYDMFRERVMFPIINAQGKVLGFGGRAMGDAQPKYLNTSDTPVFNKRLGLYAINMVRKEGAQKRLILVEGYMDVVSLRRAGVTGVVATLGTALTEEQARLIKRYAREVWISYDGDAPGQRAILRALDIFEPLEDVKARVLVFPDGMDPDDFIRMHGLSGFEKLKPMDPIAYRMQAARQNYDLNTEDGRTEYAISCCKMLKSVRNPVELSNHLERLMIDTGFERQVLLDQIGTSILKVEPQKKPRRTSPKVRELTEPQKAERDLIMLLSHHLIPLDAVTLNDFDTELFRFIAEKLVEGVSTAGILDSLSEDQRKLAAGALTSEVLPEEDKALTVAEDCLNVIRAHRIELAIEQNKALLGSLEGEERRSLMEKTIQLTQELNRLKGGRKG